MTNKLNFMSSLFYTKCTVYFSSYFLRYPVYPKILENIG